ncbi:MAG: hypothetical protein ABIY58_08875 [Acidimicrobiales bacterium]
MSGLGAPPPGGGWRDDVRAALPGWVAARVITLAALALAAFLRPRWPVALPGTARFARGGLLGWDADWYRRIAEHGYDGIPDQGLRFFPLLPELARTLGLGTHLGIGIALLLLANGPALGVGALTSRLVRSEGGDEPLARLAATLVALAPPAFVLVMGYTEAIALCALLGAILAARATGPPEGRSAGRWWTVAGFGLVAGLARPTGLLLGIPLAILALDGLRRAGWAERAGRAAAVVSPALGAAPYLIWAQLDRGDWYAPYRVQSLPGLRGDFVDPFTRVGRALGTLIGGGVGVDAHDLWVPVAVVLLIPAIRRWSPSLVAFSVVTTVVALSAEHLGSFERYQWASIVPVLTVAWLCRGPLARRLAPLAAGAGLALLATLAFLGYYVP